MNPAAGYRDAAARLGGIAGAVEAEEIDGPAARRAVIECLEGLGAWVRAPKIRSALAGLVARVRATDSLSADNVRELASALGRLAGREEGFQASLRGMWG